MLHYNTVENFLPAFVAIFMAVRIQGEGENLAVDFFSQICYC